MTAAPCSRDGCRKSTIDPSGRCAWHRDPTSGPVTGAKSGPPVPTTTSEWVPGTVHATGGYDSVEIEPGNVTYTFLGRKHRLDGPAVTIFYEDGSLYSEEYFEHDVAHRTDGPAIIRYAQNGVLIREGYRAHGKQHRVDGPADRFFHDDGSVHLEGWMTDGKSSRLDGPAVYSFAEKDTLASAAYYYDGVELRDAETHARFREAFESGAPVEWAFAYAFGESS